MSRVQTLRAQGFKAVPPHSTQGLHPLAIALAEGNLSLWGKQGQGVLCVLRWPQPEKQPKMALPLVFMQRGSGSMQLVARSAREYVTRVLAEEDSSSGNCCMD